MDTGRISEGPGGSPGLVSSGSDKGEIRSVLAQNHIAYRGLPNHPRERFFPSFFQRLTRSARGFATAGKAAPGTGLALAAFAAETPARAPAFAAARTRTRRYASVVPGS